MNGGDGGFEGSNGFQLSNSGFVIANGRRDSQNQNASAVVSYNNPTTIIREQDRFMPIANVIRIMRRVLPSHAKISDEAKETVQECVSEFISFITSEANDHCQQEQRKTITADDVIWAMCKLGFDSYVDPLSSFLSHYREAEGGQCGVVRSKTFMVNSDALPPTKQSVTFFGGTLSLPPLSSLQPKFHMGQGGNHYGIYGDGESSGMLNDSSGDESGVRSSHYITNVEDYSGFN